MCGGNCCLLKTCCLGKDLSNGCLAWAVGEIVFLLCMTPMPQLMTEVAYYSTYFLGWIIFLIFVNALLILGIKSGKPAFLMIWLIVYALDIVVLFTLWIVFFAAVGLMESGIDFDIDSYHLMNMTLGEIRARDFTMAIFCINMIILFLVPPFHVYFWLVVRSLRRTWIMEIAINFDPNRQDLHAQKQTVWDRLYEGRKRPNNEVGPAYNRY